MCFVCILGTLMHFFYEWSGDLTIIGILCPVNESVWEHLKLIFYPFIFWEIAEYFIFNDHTPLAFSKLCGALCGMTATLAVHYIYTGASGKESMAADIISFVLGIGAAFGVSFLIMKNRTKKKQAVRIDFDYMHGDNLPAFYHFHLYAAAHSPF